jgi:hypothetical protein
VLKPRRVTRKESERVRGKREEKERKGKREAKGTWKMSIPYNRSLSMTTLYFIPSSYRCVLLDMVYSAFISWLCCFTKSC